MKLKIDYIDNEIIFEEALINVLEIENKSYFYRVVSDLFKTQKGDLIDEIHYYEEELKEVVLNTKFKIIVDYFNIDFDSKKCIGDMTKKLEPSDSVNKLINKKVKELSQLILKTYSGYDVPLYINEELNISDIIKFVKLSIAPQNHILSDLLLLIDIEKILDNNLIIVLINVKQYLKKEELVELYKYSVYNKVRLLLIDSQSYGVSLDYEKKIIIDEDLNEILI